MEEKKVARKPFHTPIKEDLMVAFKSKCKKLELPMNTVIEAFMRDFNNNRFFMCMEKDEETNDVVFGFRHADKE